MSQERSVHFSGKSRKTWVALGALGGLALAGAMLVGGKDAPRARGPRPESGSPATSLESSPRAAPTTPHLVRAPEMRGQRKTQTAAPAGARRKIEERPASEAETRLIATAHRELTQLEVQEPQNFLAIFDMMREEAPGNDKALEAGRSASHTYILARMRILDQMLRRFIDDPESDQAVESDALAHLDADFKQTVDTLARDVPSMASIPEILTTTMLKAPAFTDPSPEAE